MRPALEWLRHPTPLAGFGPAHARATSPLLQQRATAGARLVHLMRQPALHAWPHARAPGSRLALQRIYNTVQCYLKDSHSRLLTELERARREVRKRAVVYSWLRAALQGAIS